ncbi:MAG: TIGR02186 family protein [Desulfosarcinaceae bacterium]
MRRFSRFLLLLVYVGIGLGIAAATWAVPSDGLSIQPEILDINTFYSGGTIKISGTAPSGQDVVIEIIGPAADNQFDIKGKVGPFWMTQDKVEMDGAPAMYVLLLPAGSEWTQKAAAQGLGLANLKSKVRIESSALPSDELFDMFLKLKMDQDLYIERQNAVIYETADDGSRRFSAAYRFPRSTSAGSYSIRATTIADGVRESVRTRPFKVDEVGFIHLVDSLATNQRLAYGILAVVIALFTGAVMGLLFKGGGSH